jgi:hypothetical protein
MTKEEELILQRQRSIEADAASGGYAVVDCAAVDPSITISAPRGILN